MRRFSIILYLLIFLAQVSGFAQETPLPAWDFRSTIPFQVRVGLRVFCDQQNIYYSGFIDAEYSFARDLRKKEFRENTPNFYNRNTNHSLQFYCEAQRNKKKYNVNPDQKGNKSWTLIFSTTLKNEVYLGPIDQSYFTYPTEKIKHPVIGVNYGLISTTNTSALRYLGNTNGRVTLSLRDIGDNWGGSIYLQNDFWVFFLKKQINKHDHGNTTEFGISSYLRPDLVNSKDFSNSLAYYDFNKFSFDYWFQIITDRKIANTTSSSFARLGYYTVRDTSSFHGYHRLGATYSNEWLTAKVGLMFDDLLLGRNLQRWAHQGTNNRNLKNRKRKGWILDNKEIYKSEISFMKKGLLNLNSINNRRVFLKQVFYNKLQYKYDELRNVIPDSIEKINALSNNEVKKIYKESEKIETLYKEQLFVNKYRYKRTKVKETTALFPWKKNDSFYEKIKPKVFGDFQIFKTSIGNE